MGIPKSLIYSFFPVLRDGGMSARVPTMVFVDGENLSKRYKDHMERRGMGSTLAPTPWYEPDVFLWSDVINELCNIGGVTRKHYYTAVVGSNEKLESIEERLKEAGIEAPYVFKRPKQTSGRVSKAVDISLAVDMLSHASRRNYDLAVLIAGDGDYVPLVRAVKAEGSRVYVWFFQNGLSRDLRMSADYYADISVLFPF